MIEPTALILSIAVHVVLITIGIIGALTVVRWLWRLADVLCLEWYSRRAAKIVKTDITPPSQAGGKDFKFWTLPGWWGRDRAAAIILTSKRAWSLKVLPGVEILLVATGDNKKRADDMKLIKRLLDEIYLRLHKERNAEEKEDVETRHG